MKIHFVRILICAAAAAANCFAAETVLREQPALRIVADSEKENNDKDEKVPQDKSIYNLFRPVPKEFMREMTTDRPDATESARTLDAGHFQIEAGAFAFTLDERSLDRAKPQVKTYEFWNTNYKVGVLNNVDLHLVVPSFTYQSTRVNGRTTVQQGFGDVTVRSKINLFGNDDDGPAVALLPSIKLPTAGDHLGNGKVEGGLKVPWSFELPKAWTIAGQSDMGLYFNGTGQQYHGEYGGTLNFGHKIVGKLSGYLEFYGNVSTERGSRWVGTFNTGVAYEINDNVRWDAGVNTGVTRSADDVNVFTGFSLRF